MSVYEIVTERIIKMMEAGTPPWRAPWRNGFPINWKSQKVYRGINLLLLSPGEYVTYKQMKEAGGTLKKDQSAYIAVFFKMLENNDTKEKFPMMRYYKVFNIEEQIDGMELRRQPTEPLKDTEVFKTAEEIAKNFPDGPEVLTGTTLEGAYYNIKKDIVVLPPKKEFVSLHEYYSTMFHELAHSTGNARRLNRFMEDAGDTKYEYTKEELVAEIGSAMLCGVAGIAQETLENSAAYLTSWMKRLKDDPKMIVSAASAAQKAADYIQDIKPER